MHILRGEEADDLIEHTLCELKGLLLARTEYLVENAPVGLHLIRAARAAQVGIGSQCSLHVSGHIDLGNDRDEAVGSIGHNLAYLVLRVVSAIALVVVEARVAPHHRALAPGAHLGEPWVFLDFHAPSLVVGDMEMEGIDMVQRQHVEILLHEVDAKEVAAHVEMHPTIGKPWFVGHHDSRNLYLRGSGYGERLAQGLHAIEHALGGKSFYPHLFLIHGDAVALLGRHFLVGLHHDGVFGCLARHHRQQFSGRLLDIVGKETRHAHQVGVAIANDRLCGTEGKRLSFLCLALTWKGNGVEVGHLLGKRHLAHKQCRKQEQQCFSHGKIVFAKIVNEE